VPNWIEFPDYTENELTEILQLMLKDRGFTADDDAITEARSIFEKVRCLDNFGNGRYVRNFLDKAIKEQSLRLFSGEKELNKVSEKNLFRITREDICKVEELSGREDRKPGTALKELDAMVGLSSVKKVIHKAISKYKYGKLCMEKGLSNNKVSLHMVFTGNPGTAKTTVARLFAEILKDEHILPSGNFVEAGRADLIGPVVGSTAIIVKKKFKEAKGGVIFIDEAYSLCDDRRNSFGDEAINTIVQEMENHRDDVIVIFAGYPEPMKDFLDRNPGMRSRIAFNVAFEDYSVDELCEITKLMLSSKKMHITDAAMNKLKGIYETVHEREDYGNGRFVRQRLEEAELNLADRLMKLAPDELTEERISTIEESDITYTDDADAKTAVKRQFGFAS
jgi:SpoVK/Ycf46/Vps4 family AAA+-type ATPase